MTGYLICSIVATYTSVATIGEVITEHVPISTLYGLVADRCSYSTSDPFAVRPINTTNSNFVTNTNLNTNSGTVNPQMNTNSANTIASQRAKLYREKVRRILLKRKSK